MIREYEGATSQISSSSISPFEQSTSFGLLLSTSYDGTVFIHDSRSAEIVHKFIVNPGTPKWAVSSCWSNSGEKVFVGRRNGMIEEYDLRSLNSIKFNNPKGSGPVSLVKMFPNDRHLLWLYLLILVVRMIMSVSGI
jgi:transcriptional activator SPT8